MDRRRLEAMLTAGHDNAGLRLAVASKCLDEDDALAAIMHAKVALELDPDYSAAWKLLGKAQVRAGRKPEAIETYRSGIDVAARRGDKQAEREMRTFLKRLQRS